MTTPLAAPPYALATTEFPCTGLAAQAARAPIGGQREAALACVVLARLAIAVGPPVELSSELRRERAEAARAWLGTIPLEQSIRALLIRALNATGSAGPRDVAAELELVAEKLAGVLDATASDDLRRIAARLRG